MTLRQTTLRAAILAGAAAVALPADAQEEIKIGYLGGLTGYLAPYDQPSLAGVEVAVEEINAAGGIGGTMPIELIVRDMRSDTAQASVMAQELVSEGVSVMITPCDVDPSIAAGLVAQAAQVPAITSCASTPTLPATVGDYMFSNYTADNLQAAALASHAVEQGYTTAWVMLSPDTPYTQRLPEYFVEAFTNMGGEVLDVVEYTMGQQDFSAEVTNITNLDALPDVIMTSAYEPDFPAFIRALRGAGIETPVLGSDGIDSPTTTALGDVAEGVVFTNAGFPTEGSALAAFYERYEAYHGSPAETAFTATGYDMIKVIEAAVIATEMSTDGATLRDAIDSVEGVEGATGSVSYAGTDRVPVRNVALNLVTGGAVEHLADVTPDPADIPAP